MPRGGQREGAGRPKNSTRRARYLGPVLAAEASVFRLLPACEKPLKRAIERGEGWAIRLVFEYGLTPARLRADLVAALECERLAGDVEDDDVEAADR